MTWNSLLYLVLEWIFKIPWRKHSPLYTYFIYVTIIYTYILYITLTRQKNNKLYYASFVCVCVRVYVYITILYRTYNLKVMQNEHIKRFIILICCQNYFSKNVVTPINPCNNTFQNIFIDIIGSTKRQID